SRRHRAQISRDESSLSRRLHGKSGALQPASHARRASRSARRAGRLAGCAPALRCVRSRAARVAPSPHPLPPASRYHVWVEHVTADPTCRHRRGPARESDMKAHARVSRRDFLKTGATTAAGLTIAFYIPSRFTEVARGEAPTLSGSDGAFAPNGWVHIGTDGVVTITVDKSEMGQGVNTSYPMLVAEELDADFAQVRVGAAPENPAGWTRRMGTGGSSSVRSSYDTLRKAGA